MWRTDILHEVDLIEDIAIAYGYENFIPEIPEISTIGKEGPKETIKRKICAILTGLNMLEVSNYHLTTKKDQFTRMGISDQEIKKGNFIEVENSKTEYEILRKNLAHYLLKILSENVDTEYPQKIFEIGKIFSLDQNTDKITEHEHLSLAITPGNFTEIKQALEYLFRMLNIKIQIKEPETPISSAKIQSYFIEGRIAEIIMDNKIIGNIGEIHPKIIKNWKIKMPIALFEISLEDIFEKAI